ncbi:hypothetical protein DL96DRAFT_1687683 [Flagelloscypha sp. PMI_526]|nr:hypothetical protein DL96DRAFT_1687683 [Flagelloscypha sp. PMI_526]
MPYGAELRKDYLGTTWGVCDPHLPRELERKIFELIVVVHPETSSNLALVCRRFTEWLEHVRFHTLRITLRDGVNPNDPPRFLTLKEPSFLQAHVKEIKVVWWGGYGPSNEWIPVLASCTQVAKLTLHANWIPYKWYRPADNTRKEDKILSAAGFFIKTFVNIRSLTLDLRMSLAFGQELRARPISFNLLTRLCCSLTILGDAWKGWLGYRYLPSLTHILSIDAEHRPAVLHNFLDHVPRLVLLAIVARPRTVTLHHPKLVIMCLKKPHEIVEGIKSGISQWSEHDLWQRAEKVMKERKMHECDAS